MTPRNILLILALMGLFYFIFSSASAGHQVYQVDTGDVKIVKTNIFTIHYNEKLEQPSLVEYEVKCTNTKFSRQGLFFYPCDTIHTSDEDDYRDNPWDKGHMAPAASFACNRDELVQTFSYLNCALQHENLNRGVWKSLELHERELAKTQSVKVKVQLHFSKGSRVLPTGATVPDAFTKTIYYGKTKRAYRFENSKPLYKDFERYWINI